jgi:hypothetical protein
MTEIQKRLWINPSFQEYVRYFAALIVARFAASLVTLCCDMLDVGCVGSIAVAVRCSHCEADCE